MIRRVSGTGTAAPRGEVVARYLPALEQPGDSERGEQVYKRECANCHTPEPLANQTPRAPVGPDLKSVRHRGPEEILLHILDPNREVAPQHVNYVVTLQDGRVLLTGGYTGALDGSGAGVKFSEIVDPATNQLAVTSDMPMGRYYHSMVTLPNGHVLVVGYVYRAP